MSWPGRPGLGAEEFSAPARLAQRDPDGAADGAAGPGTQRRQFGDQGSRGAPGEAGAQVIGTGHDQGPGLAAGLDPVGAGAAPGDHQHPDRPDGAVPALRCAASPARLRGPGGADRVQRVRLALPAPVPAVRADCLGDPDAGCGDVHVCMSDCATGDDAGLYDGQCHLFSLADGMARTGWPSDP
jgi:hypothetical protein